MVSSQLAANIKYFRKQYNWTQQKLADELKVSRSVIAKWENGDVLPDLTSIIKLSHVFKQSIDHLLGLNRYSNQFLNDFQQFYETKHDNGEVIDESLLSVVDYLIKNPPLKEQIVQLSQLTVKQQRAALRILKTTITETKRL
ncbi:helix-turn-helix transcriptional regulator [Amphibacillus sediminis]|uniref:helix-turn-helix transcriptional regulator n=1 Tax=Amphibacillus sediminis TaxID=360185 RepID=UPI00082DB724|nr:helix-turn-helix transcriptional regulator [Amphibacillus sediminis]